MRHTHNIYHVYGHRKTDTGELFYIGKGTRKRAVSDKASRRTNKYGRKTHWANIVDKHGYFVEIYHDNLSELEAFEIEILYITDIGRLDLGTGPLINKTNGGEGAAGHVKTPKQIEAARKHMLGNKFSVGLVRSSETRRKIGLARRGKKVSEMVREKLRVANTGKVASADTRKKLSDLNKGENNPMYGKPVSLDIRKRISESKKGEKHPMYGKHLSSDTRKKLSDLNKGENNPMYGKVASDETRKKMSEAQKECHRQKKLAQENPAADEFFI